VVSLSDAVRSFGLLASGVGAKRGSLKQRAGIHHNVASRRNIDGEMVHPSWGWTTFVLAHPVVLRAVATTLKPLAGETFRYPTPEVWALLIRSDEAGAHSGQQRSVVR
jgi:hypothetical protein